MSPADHLIALPIVLPLAAAALMLLLDERRHGLKGAISLVTALVVLIVAADQVGRAQSPVTHVYALGDWPAPFGIVLVADRLSALMVLLAASIGLAALVFSLARWHRAGPHFHSLSHFLLAGLNGAFLTGDLFNLFVFFELLLAASYALALHGSGTARVRASLHYIVVNLSASLLFLIGVALIYGVAGTLNLADLAARVPRLAAQDRVLLEIGGATLGIAFLVKAGMWPLGFWLPPTYCAASAPAAALFSILSKVGVYALARVWLIVFGGVSGSEFLAWGGIATLVFGILGVLGSQDLGRLASFSLFVSSGTLLAAVGLGGAAAAGAAIYYLFASTLGIAAFFLVAELIDRSRAPGAEILAVTADAFGLDGDQFDPKEEEVGMTIPASTAVLGLAYACAALLIAGLPPLPGFVAKFSLLQALIATDPVPGVVWALFALLIFSGLAAVIGFGRAGARAFWSEPERKVARVQVVEAGPVTALLVFCLALTISAGPAMQYAYQAAQELYIPGRYVTEVLGRP